MFIRPYIALSAATFAISGTPAFAAGNEGLIPEIHLGFPWALPFVGILLSIAILPLVAPHFWHRHYGKVSAAWALAFLIPFAAVQGTFLAQYEFLHVMLLDYLPFIVLLLALYVISGGVFIDGQIRGTPWTNTAILAGGTMIASLAGTTGASVLLIRPLLRANAGRKYNAHVVIFFIFLVSNIGGSLTPLGDPPLYLGYLKGVAFFWPAHFLWQKTLLIAVILLATFFVLDAILSGDKPGTQRTTAWPDAAQVKLKGWRNIILLCLVPVAILGSAMWKTDLHLAVAGVSVGYPDIARSLALLWLAAISMMFTPQAYRAGNSFTWGPIVEVAKLFAGIFITIVPVIMMLREGANGAFAPLLTLLTYADGTPNNAMYFWLTGGLSSFLDNAPTYLVFFNAAGGDPQHLMTDMAATLAAISAGAVFMGANTYIGNAPNFMVKAIAEEAGVNMPSFFVYMVWSAAFLLPCFALVTYLFFM